MKKVKVKEAVKILARGGLVIVPTETVYGLAADALDAVAVEKIYKAKERPSNNPLIMHIDDVALIEDLVDGISDDAVLLMNKFWPGPLTLIFKKTELVPRIVTAGLPTVCIRMPNNKLTLEIIKKLGKPIAAPSANISGRPSPTRVEHIELDLPVVDGGVCEYGLESTVLDMFGEVPIILRQGPISKEQLEQVLGYSVKIAEGSEGAERSPGRQHPHYSPNGKVQLFEDQNKIKEMLHRDDVEKVRCGVIVAEKYSGFYEGADEIVLPDDINGQAQVLYEALLESERREWEEVLVDLNGIGGDGGIGATIRERLYRAAE